MNVKLLKKLRKIGYSKVTIYSVTKTNGLTTGMKIGFDEDEYRGIFELGDTEADVKHKACKIYLQTNIDAIRKRYSKRRKAGKE